MDIPSRCPWDHATCANQFRGALTGQWRRMMSRRRSAYPGALVSLAFRGTPGVSEESRRTILETARLLGYRHNVIAADLATKTRSTIGLYLLDFRNEVFADVFRGVRNTLERSGNRVILGVSDADEPTDQRAVGSLIEARVGVIIAGALLPNVASTYGGRVGQGGGVICDRAAPSRSCATGWKRGIAGRFGR